MDSINKVQLITYPDSLGKDLKELRFVLDNFIKDSIGGIHILPFYPSSGDRGFSPLTHLEVDHKFGTWDDIKNIGSKYILMTDLILNHISSKSKYFQDYLKKNENSRYKELFLKTSDLFPEDKINFEDLKKIYRPRTKDPFTPYIFKDGTTKKLWTTFTPEQIDLNWQNQITMDLMTQFIKKLTQNNVKITRIDAAGYIIKEMGTNCFFRPKVHKIIKKLKESVKNQNTKILLEVHHKYGLQRELAKKIDYVYDFALPMVLLHTLYTGDSKNLKKWIKIRPNNCFITLDTHDGIGIIDVERLLKKEIIKKAVSTLYENQGRAALKASGKHSDNLDIYQINCTYYSALAKNDKAYLCARAVQFFLPGIPQVYYVGLLAGENDLEQLNKTNNGRDINRHNYTIEEIKQNMKRNVVKELMKLMKFRNNNDIFNGKFNLEKTKDSILKLSWSKEKKKCILTVDLKKHEYKITQN